MLIFGERTDIKTHTPVYISGAEVEQMNSIGFLAIGIMDITHLHLSK